MVKGRYRLRIVLRKTGIYGMQRKSPKSNTRRKNKKNQRRECHKIQRGASKGAVNLEIG